MRGSGHLPMLHDYRHHATSVSVLGKIDGKLFDGKLRRLGCGRIVVQNLPGAGIGGYGRK